MNWIAISAFTRNTPYELEAHRLRASLLTFGVPFVIYDYESQGSWKLNCEYNDHIRRAAFDTFLGKNILWLDADAELMKYPDLFDDYGYDLGIYKRIHTEKQKEQTGADYHWDTGTMFMKNKPEVRKLVGILGSINPVDNGAGWMLERFNKAVNDVIAGVSESKLRIGTLPVTYSYIFDTKQPEEVKYKVEVVIKHHQASRRLKDKI